MNTARAAIEKKLFEEFASALATVFETMAGERPLVDCEDSASPPVEEGLRWKQPLPPLPGPAWVCVSEEGWKTAGKAVLSGAGIEDASDAELKSTYVETLGQALGSLAQALTSALGREVTCAGGAESADPFGNAAWAKVTVTLSAASFVLGLGLDSSLADALLAGQTEAPAQASKAAAAGATPAAATTGTTGSTGTTGQGSKTFDLLLDVELPVSVSFGHASVALKDVLKLTTGSIVELDRAVVEPVDVVVNNRVIARGEVVVVEGNFGVRIQRVVSRNERLQSLK